jgi:predicted KAP-like P-loop ATPase
MADDPEKPRFSPDKPLEDPKDDALGYAPFAKRLADALGAMAPDEGFVVAIHGPWGTGKTTVVNFVLHYLHKQGQRFVAVRFNPWWFGEHEDLTRAYFAQLMAAAGHGKEKGTKLRERLADLAEAVAEMPIPYVAFAKAGKLVRPKAKDVGVIKEELAKALREGSTRFLVVIDDIDRLQPDETRQMFRLIKAVADLPHVMYLLAFDRDVVAQVLGDGQAGQGGEFLEKIVQVGFNLPEPEKGALMELVGAQLTEVLGETPDELVDKKQFSKVLWRGASHFIQTPRDVTRLINFLRLTYPAVVGEVNAADFVGVEALRVFLPELYDTVRRNPQEFTPGRADTPAGLFGDQQETFKSFHNGWLNRIPDADRGAAQDLMLTLFPRLASVWSNTSYSSDWYRTWRKQRRVCHPDVFPLYFRLSLPAGSISAAEMRSIVTAARDSRSFEHALLALDVAGDPSKSRLPAFLDLARDYTEAIAAAGHTENVLEALFQQGDALMGCQAKKAGLLGGVPVAWQVDWWVADLLKGLEYGKRATLLQRLFQESPSITLPVEFLRTLGHEHGLMGGKEPKPEEQRLVQREDFERLGTAVIEKVRKAAADGTLARAPLLEHVLFYWHEIDGAEASKTWINQAIRDRRGLLKVLQAFRSEMLRQGADDVGARRSYSFDTNFIRRFVDVDRLAERTREELDSSDNSADEKRLCELYLRDYQRMLDGKGTSFPSDWHEDEE